jgi:hypothetical protein
MTSGQKNALDSAQSYLDMQGFSKAGLIQQLSSSAGEGSHRHKRATRRTRFTDLAEPPAPFFRGGSEEPSGLRPGLTQQLVVRLPSSD